MTDENSNQLHVWCALKTNTDGSREKALGLFSAAGGNFKFEDNGDHFMIGGNTYDTIASMSTGQAEDVELTLISVKQIGFMNDPTYREVIDKISRSKKIDFCQSAEELILSRKAFSNQKEGQRATIPFHDGKTCFRLEFFHSASRGRSELWLLQGVCDPKRFCTLDELFIVRIAKKVERQQPSQGSASAVYQIISSLQDHLINKNPTL